MKTRREFFKTLAGSMAVVAACVVMPKSLMGKEEKLLEPVEERLDNIDSWIIVTDTNWDFPTGISRKQNSNEYDHIMKYDNTHGWKLPKGT